MFASATRKLGLELGSESTFSSPECEKLDLLHFCDDRLPEFSAPRFPSRRAR